MTDMVPVPTAIACAECGKPVHALTSYGVTTPLEGPVPPGDLCGLACLRDWAVRHLSERRPS